MDSLLQEVREEAWNGLIPAEFTMDSSEITSLQRPLPLYVSVLARMYNAAVSQSFRLDSFFRSRHDNARWRSRIP